MRFFSLGSGAALTVWLAPAAVEFYGITSTRYIVLLAFFCGFAGPYMLAAASEWLRSLKWSEILSLIFNLRGKK